MVRSRSSQPQGWPGHHGSRLKSENAAPSGSGHHRNRLKSETPHRLGQGAAESDPGRKTSVTNPKGRGQPLRTRVNWSYWGGWRSRQDPRTQSGVWGRRQGVVGVLPHQPGGPRTTAPYAGQMVSRRGGRRRSRQGVVGVPSGACGARWARRDRRRPRTQTSISPRPSTLCGRSRRPTMPCRCSAGRFCRPRAHIHSRRGTRPPAHSVPPAGWSRPPSATRRWST